MNTFRLRLPQMFAKIIAAESDDKSSVCGSKTATTANVTNVFSSSCRGVSVIMIFGFLFLISDVKQIFQTTALVDPKIYVNSMIIGAATFSMFWVAIYITKYWNKNNIYSK